ncbi:glycosyltransferase family 2 protein [Herbaspirillum aquaticum]|uniref:glycosyltransferase family 2 protein n=1 Tax=Herbaspirillum aquaticum TaxID=568783 RepID=UPI0024DEF669|nr:glycosyltransferase [Herbaspirillum aquaticum]
MKQTETNIIDSRPPLVSVLMPVYNGERYLQPAIRSILGQTMGDFELIVIDDASRDSTPELLAACADPRLRVIRHDSNRGIVEALNHGLSYARGQYIARMDADDISHPERLQKQLAFLQHHPEVGLVGSWIRGFGEVRRKYIHRYPATHDAIRALMLFENAFAHSTVMFRRGLLLEHGLGYSERFKYVEDWALWWQISSVSRVANLPEVLLEYRINKAGTSYTGTSIQTRSRLDFVEARLQEAGLPFRQELAEMAPSSLQELEALSEAFAALLAAHARHPFMHDGALRECVQQLWFRSCCRARRRGFAVARLYVSAPHAALPWSVRTRRFAGIVIRSYGRQAWDLIKKIKT